jgi:hypothetical protein
MFAEMIAEPFTVSLDYVEKFAIQNFKSKDPGARVISREMRNVNGRAVLTLTVDVKTEGVELRYINYYYTGTSGTIQLMAWSAQAYFDANLNRLEELLDGLEVVE